MSEITSKTTAFGQEVYFVGGFSVSEKVYIAAQELEKENAELKEAYEHLCDIHLAATQPIFLGEAILEMEKTAKNS